MNTYEEPGQYKIEVYPEKNRYHLYFTGTAKKPGDIPHYIEHIGKALEKLKSGFTLYVELTTHVKPGFQITSLFRTSQKMTMAAGLRKAAIYLPKGFIVEKMVLNVTKSLSKMPISTFDDKEKAVAWLDEK